MNLLLVTRSIPLNVHTAENQEKLADLAVHFHITGANVWDETENTVKARPERLTAGIVDITSSDW
jgi:hypothetical protein